MCWRRERGKLVIDDIWELFIESWKRMPDFNYRLTKFLQVPRGFSLLPLSQKKLLTLKQKTKQNKQNNPKRACVSCVIKLLRIVPLSLSKAESYCWFCIEEKDTLCSHRFSDQKIPIICSSAPLFGTGMNWQTQPAILAVAHDKTCTNSALKIRVWATSKTLRIEKPRPSDS